MLTRLHPRSTHGGNLQSKCTLFKMGKDTNNVSRQTRARNSVAQVHRYVGRGYEDRMINLSDQPHDRLSPFPICLYRVFPALQQSTRNVSGKKNSVGQKKQTRPSSASQTNNGGQRHNITETSGTLGTIPCCLCQRHISHASRDEKRFSEKKARKNFQPNNSWTFGPFPLLPMWPTYYQTIFANQHLGWRTAAAIKTYQAAGCVGQP